MEATFVQTFKLLINHFSSTWPISRPKDIIDNNMILFTLANSYGHLARLIY